MDVCRVCIFRRSLEVRPIHRFHSSYHMLKHVYPPRAGHSQEWASPKDQRAWFANISGAILEPHPRHDEL